MVNTANEVVTITVNSKPSAEGARKVVVKPIGDEYSLRELNMIETNRKKVDAASGGRIGYVYLPNMGRRSQPVHEAVLSADSQGRPYIRRSLQRWRALSTD